MLRCDKLTADPNVQPREALDEDVVADYAEVLKGGPPAEFPAVIVFTDGRTWWLASGFHRLAAYIRAGRKTITVDVRQGTRRDAILFAVGANHKHGLRLTNADKRRAVQIMLADLEWKAWSNRQIAEQCGVSEYLVREVRAELDADASASKSQMRTSSRGGTTYEMDVGNISQASRKRQEQTPSLDDREKAAVERVAVEQIGELARDCRRKHLSFCSDDARDRADVALDEYLATLPASQSP